MHRDLKPGEFCLHISTILCFDDNARFYAQYQSSIIVLANIGFDVRGDVKIFDLGLAKELKPIQQVGPDQFHTSGIAGTRRYMAPGKTECVYQLSAFQQDRSNQLLDLHTQRLLKSFPMD